MPKGLLFSSCVCGLLIAVLCGAAAWDARRERQSQSSVDGLVSTSVPVSKGAQAANSPNESADALSTQASSSGNIPDVAGAHALDPVLELARRALDKMRSDVKDYTAKLIKRERIAGRLGDETTMELKVIDRKMQGNELVTPLHAYLKFEKPWLTKGREVIWVEGLNDGKLISHEGASSWPQFRLNPLDKLAMTGNKYPITEIGLTRLVEKLIEKGERDRELGPCKVSIEDGHKVGDRACQLIQVTHPDPDERFDFHIAQIFLDAENMIPLRYAAFLWPDKPGGAPVLEEEYTYLNVRLNVGLTSADFKVDNPAYRFQ